MPNPRFTYFKFFHFTRAKAEQKVFLTDTGQELISLPSVPRFSVLNFESNRGTVHNLPFVSALFSVFHAQIYLKNFSIALKVKLNEKKILTRAKTKMNQKSQVKNCSWWSAFLLSLAPDSHF